MNPIMASTPKLAPVPLRISCSPVATTTARSAMAVVTGAIGVLLPTLVPVTPVTFISIAVASVLPITAVGATDLAFVVWLAARG